MADLTGISIIKTLQRRWMGYRLLIHIVLALAVALILSHVLHVLMQLPFWSLPVFFVIGLACLIWWQNPWLINERTITRFLYQ